MKNSIINNRFVKQSLFVLMITIAPLMSAYAAPAQGEGWIISSNAESATISVKTAASSSGSAKLTISDRMGNVVYNAKLKNNTNTINLGQMNEGSYTVSIQDGQQVKTYKLQIL